MCGTKLNYNLVVLSHFTCWSFSVDLNGRVVNTSKFGRAECGSSAGKENG